METKFFRVAGLPSCLHTKETRAAFEQYVNGDSVTKFVTKTIVIDAERVKFVYWIPIEEMVLKPHYILEKRFAEILSMIDKSRGKDYTYLVAFEWLLWKHPGASKSFLQRQAVTNFNSS